MQNIFIFGATSAIAEATARLFAEDGGRFFLVARDSAKLQAIAADLRVRGALSTATAMTDACDFGSHAQLVASAFDTLGRIDNALIAHGSLPDQRACQESVEPLLKEFETNALSVMSLLTPLANQMERQGSGTIAVITSVAGDRGRQSNYVYGAAKGAVALFLQGLRDRLHGAGVNVLTVKPGLVDTPMTARFTKGLLWSDPATVARGIYDAVHRQKSVVYLPWFWRPIMYALRALPETVFRRLRL